jgi:hypothetical protein
MAKSTSTGYTDTAIAGDPDITFDVAELNYAVDWRVKSDKAGEVVLTNITCPTDRPEKIRIAYSTVANVYSGTGISSTVYAPTKEGVSLLIQLTETLSVTDSVDADYRVDLPVSYHMVMKFPASEFIDESVVETGISRLLSVLYETGETSETRLASLIRGALKPADL